MHHTKPRRELETMWNAVPFLMAQAWFDRTYRRWGLFQKKTSVMSWLLARSYSFQIASLIAYERSNNPLTLMKFVGVDKDTAEETLNNGFESIERVVNRFNESTGRMPLSPLDIIFNSSFPSRRIVTMDRVYQYDNLPLDDIIGTDSNEAYRRIWLDSMLGIAYALRYPQLVNASLYLYNGDLLFETDDETGFNADHTRALAESETLRQVAFDLNPHDGVYKHLDLWSDLNLHEFANITVRYVPMRNIDNNERTV